MAFERSMLRALNIAPTQLHPNNWGFVRAFELLCEDWGRAPSLGVFFWFFSLRKVVKVGWTSLSSRPRQKLLKPFLESFKTFKDKYFKPAVSVTIVRKDLERWEDEFITELENLPHLSCSELIRGIGSYLTFKHDLKRKLSQTADERTSVSTILLAVVNPLASLKKNSPAVPLVISGSPEDSLQGAAVWLDEGRLPTKQANLGDLLEPHNDQLPSEVDLDFQEIILRRPSSPSIRELTPFDGSLVRQLGVTGTLGALQRLANCSAILAHAVEAEFGPMVERVDFLTNRLNQKSTVGLQEELQRSVDQNRELLLAQADWELTRASLHAEVENVKKSCQHLEAFGLVSQEKISLLESDLAQVRAKCSSKEALIKTRDATIFQQGLAMVHQYEYGFNQAMAQVKALYPDLDISEADPYTKVVDGQIVDVPSPPGFIFLGRPFFRLAALSRLLTGSSVDHYRKSNN
ncbi:hypothetical protein CR513_50404, partial [Mucuna pruriens]